MTASPDDGFAHNSHPDESNILRNNVRQDAFQAGNILDETLGDPYTKARWESASVSPARGPVDMNFTRDDGGVVRLSHVALRDESRLVPVPEYAGTNEFTNWATYLARP